jgi:hypothetical protein
MADGEIRVTAGDGSFSHALLLHGEAVSELAVVDLTMRIGIASVRMGGIAGVGTDDKHRKKGYARRVLENCNVWMEENGFDCALLFGIPDFYHKFGYAVCLPQCRVEVATRAAERASGSLGVRLFTPDDLPALRAIYAATNADLTGSIVRGEKTRWFRKGTRYRMPVEVFVFTGEAGAIVAYAVRDATEDAVNIGEVGALRPEYYADVARWAADRAVELRRERVRFFVPPDSACAVWLTQYGAEQKLSYPGNADGMGRLLRLNDFFTKTLPEWTRRARAAAPLPAGTSLRLETDLGGVTLRWTGDAVTLEAAAQASGSVRLPQWRLMQLAMGYYGAELTLSLPEVQADGDLLLLHTLFPRRLAFMWLADHF